MGHQCLQRRASAGDRHRALAFRTIASGGRTAPLPDAAQAQIEAMPDVHKFPFDIAVEFEQQGKAANQIADPDQKKAAQQAYQQAMNDRGKQAAARSILRALYAPDQLRERMTWFWFNHFNVHQYKANIRILVGDYEDRAIRPFALGKFHDLLTATLYHPAMLRYLDNADNAAGPSQRELCPRDHGTAHHGRRLGLYASRCRGAGAHSDRRRHRPEAGRSQTQAGAAIAAGARGRVRIQSGPARLWRQGFPRPYHQGARAAPKSTRRSNILVRHPATATHLAGRSRLISFGKSAARRWCSAWRRPSRPPTAISRRCFPP